MTLTFKDILIAFVLISVVPFQYLLVKNFGQNQSNRSYFFYKFVSHIERFKEDYLKLKSWKQWVLMSLLNTKNPNPDTSPEDDLDVGESPAIEVFSYKHKHNYFSFSPDPRIIRPPDMKFRIGQVVRHKVFKYRGVIIGWDEVAKAPAEWLEQLHGKENKEWKDMPNYSILVDTRDRLSPQMTYVAEVNLESVENMNVVHPLVEHLFEEYNGNQYIPRPWLKSLYPRD